MFRHITCHPQGALMFLPKITGKTICKTWTYIVWRVWQHMNSRVHACSVCYCSSGTVAHTAHPLGALMFLAKITVKTICETWTYIVWRVWQHIMNSRLHACSVCYCASGTVAHTARMHTRIHDMLPHPSHNIGSCFTNCFTSDFS
jgi:hypothetical protein